jgi:hypothetical protein
MSTKIFIEDEGEFHIPNENVDELINFLNSNSAVKGNNKKQMTEYIDSQFQGKELLID